MSLQFQFELRPMNEIEPWGEAGSRSLSWFGLTDGWQCVETAQGRLLEYVEPFSGRTWMDYQLARLFEDLLSAWPAIAEPVPDDVASRFFRISRKDEPALSEAWEGAFFWWQERRIQFFHLRWPPDLYLWRTGDTVSLMWDAPGEDGAKAVWSVRHARLAFPVGEVRQAVGGFCRDFLGAMKRRVAEITRDGWKRSDCTVDVARLMAEQQERTERAAQSLNRTTVTDWASVRRHLAELEAR